MNLFSLTFFPPWILAPVSKYLYAGYLPFQVILRKPQSFQRQFCFLFSSGEPSSDLTLLFPAQPFVLLMSGGSFHDLGWFLLLHAQIIPPKRSPRDPLPSLKLYPVQLPSVTRPQKFYLLWPFWNWIAVSSIPWDCGLLFWFPCFAL